MPTLKLAAIIVMLCVLQVKSAFAQACLGLPSFAKSAVHVNAAADFPDSASVYAVGVGAGTHNSLFGNLGAGQVKYTGYNDKTTFGFLEFGYQFPVGRAQLCPIGGGTFAAGPDDASAGIKVTSHSASGGLAFGLALGSRNFSVVPNAAVNYGLVSQKIDEEGIGTSTETSNAGVIDAGIALILANRVSIQPLAHFPFGGKDRNKSSYGVFISIAAGWPRQSK